MAPAKIIDHAGYLPIEQDHRARAIKAIMKLIKKSGIKFDGVVGRGISGALVAPEVARLLYKPLAIVRKGERRNSSRHVEVGGNMKTYVFVDDLICTGRTVRCVRRDMKPAEMVGIFLYDSTWVGRPHSKFPDVPVFGEDIRHA